MESKPRSKFLFCRAIYPKSGAHFIGLRSSVKKYAPLAMSAARFFIWLIGRSVSHIDTLECALIVSGNADALK
jgi:hypothetical protein